MAKRRPISAFLILTLSAIPSSNARDGELRAAYAYTSGEAWSAGVRLPRHDIIDIGAEMVPLGVNDAGTLILRDAGNRLLRWSWGRFDVLQENFTSSLRAFLNENGTVAASYSPDVTNRILFWHPGQVSPTLLDWADSMIAPPHYAGLFGLNDADQLVLRSDASDNLFFLPETSHIETNTVFLPGTDWTQLTQYEFVREIDYSSWQGGTIYNVYGFNNYADTVGLVHEGQASSENPDDTFDLSYFSYNLETTLDFEPLAINDDRTILGRTGQPGEALLVMDQFGQRLIGPAPGSGETGPVAMSNPNDGMEEIVHGRTYYRRMSERDTSGRYTGTPAPDFYRGSIEDVISVTNEWSSMESHCISANGRIAGTGRKYDPASAMPRTHAWMTVPPLLLPDWDRDGKIGPLDRRLAPPGEPWRFWINDDDDEGDLARSALDDRPGSATPDWDNEVVDGLRDTVDFFPLLLDIQPILESLGGTSGLVVRLRQADSALNFVYSGLDPQSAGSIHRGSPAPQFGPALEESLAVATVHAVTATGIALESHFLQGLGARGGGILLMEATRTTREPLIMEVSVDGAVVLESHLPLSTGPVADMFRVLNLRQADPLFFADPGPWPTRMEDPPNLPDAALASLADTLRTLVHVHGFNWSGDEIPAAHAEVFKRFFQAGSLARFIGISWHGDEGTIELTGNSFEYNANVVNSFVTARHMTEALQAFAGPECSVFAHSLGNMLASSSILDFQLPAGNYFMINAAVPTEAYDGDTSGRRHMVHPLWKNNDNASLDYPEHLMAANWHRLFDSADRRSFLAWKNRFAGLASLADCTNFYSTGEDVLRTGTGDIPSLLGDVINKEWVWVFNEMVKGTETFSAHLAGEVHGGWGFNRHWMDWVDSGGAAHPPPGEWVPMSASEAASIDPSLLVGQPFFHRFSSTDADYPDWGDGEWLYGDASGANPHLSELPPAEDSHEPFRNHARILAEGIPAHSAPAGSQPLAVLPLLSNVNLDSWVRDSRNWPHREDVGKRNRWLHSDYLLPALSHVFGLYQLCVTKINSLP
jgi:hypothetical protein